MGERAALLNQLDDFFHQGVFFEALLLIRLQIARLVCQHVGDLNDAFFGLGLGQPCKVCKLPPMLGGNFGVLVFVADFHGHFCREFWVNRSRQQIIKRG